MEQGLRRSRARGRAGPGAEQGLGGKGWVHISHHLLNAKWPTVIPDYRYSKLIVNGATNTLLCFPEPDCKFSDAFKVKTFLRHEHKNFRLPRLACLRFNFVFHLDD